MPEEPTYEELEQRVKELEEELFGFKRIERELRESEERFRNLTQGSIQGILIHRNHKPIFVNQKWARIHGYSIEEVLKMETVVPLISPEDQKRMLKYKEARLQGKDAPMDYEYQGVHKNGSLIWLDNRVSIVKWGEHTAIQTTIFDITSRKQTEEDREKLIGELKNALAEINTLKGILPICASCKKIRDDQGYWEQIEVYIGERSEADFSHSICPACAKELYPDMDINDE